MTIINVPDIKGPTAQLCFKQKLDPPHVMVRCDRRKGHSGLHSWEMVAQIEELTALPPSSPVADSGQPFSAWHDDDHDVLWWRLPICEPPIVTSPLSSDWPFDESDEPHLVWTRFVVPSAPSPSAGAAKEIKP